MRSFFTLIALCILSLGLSSCGTPDRGVADANFAKACEAAVKSLSDPLDIIEIKTTSFSSEKSHDGLPLRTVTFTALMTYDKGAYQAKNYMCSFEEQKTLFSYSAKFYHMEKDSLKYGNFGGTIEGNLQDLMKVNGAVDAVLN